MTHWYRHWSVQLGLRATGLALLVACWTEGRALGRLVTDPNAARGPGALLLAALLFISASLGMALTIVGPGLWKPVRLSARWQGSDPPARSTNHPTRSSH